MIHNQWLRLSTNKQKSVAPLHCCEEGMKNPAMGNEEEKRRFARRLSEALAAAGIPDERGRKVTTAKLIGVTAEAVRKWLDAETMPETKRIPGMARMLGVNGEWLLTGTGPMRPETDGEGIPYSADVLELAGVISRLPEHKRELLRSIALEMTEGGQGNRGALVPPVDRNS